MKIIVAISSTEEDDTYTIDHSIVELIGKNKPKMTFLPIPGDRQEWDYDEINKMFGQRFGCTVEPLYLDKIVEINMIGKKILSSDILYAGWGDTAKMLDTWHKMGIAKIIKQAYEKGILLCGCSAGAMCWFKWGGAGKSWHGIGSVISLDRVSGLGFINALCCPHYNQKGRQKFLKGLMKKTEGVALGIDDGCAIQFIENEYRVISTKPDSHVYKLYWKSNKFHKERVKETAELKPSVNLLTYQ